MPWKDPRTVDFHRVGYLQPAMMPAPENDATHGGEDVAIYAIGSVWRDLANIFLKEYPNHASEFKAPEPMQRVHGES